MAYYIRNMYNSLAEKIRKARLLKGLSQQNMADELNITLAGYSKIERGLTEISVNRLTKIADILGMSVVDFFQSNLSFVEDSSNLYQRDLTIEIIRMSNTISEIQLELSNLKRELTAGRHQD